MGGSFRSQILPTIVFGGLPFYIGAIFWFFPHKLSALFKGIGGPWPELNELLYSPTAMRVCGIIWVFVGIVLWSDVLQGKP